MKIWECKIGECSPADVPAGGDFPMRLAIEKVYFELTGRKPTFCFSGWGAELTGSERDCVDRKTTQ